jgi:hypothetical protein
VAEFHNQIKQESYEIPSFDSWSGSFNRHGDGSNGAEPELLQGQGMLQYGLL